MASFDSDSDWEYEYHDTETESFYVTIDLPSAALADGGETKKRKKGDSVIAKGSTDGIDAIEQRDVTAESLTSQDGPADTPDSENRIQILDLPGSTPMILYKKQVYKCSWAETLGTDILLARPESDPPFPPLHEDEGFNILATSTIKLIGQPVQLIPKVEQSQGPSAMTSNAVSGSRTDNSPSPDLVTDASSMRSGSGPNASMVPVQIPVPSAAPQIKHNQARFLERLSAVKAARGEQDKVFIHTKRRIKGTGWRSWKETSDGAGGIERPEHLTNLVPVDFEEVPSKDDDDNDDSDDDSDDFGFSNITRDGLPRQKKGRRPNPPAKSGTTRNRRIGGLFRDYRPSPGDSEGADIRASEDRRIPRNNPLLLTSVNNTGSGKRPVASEEDVDGVGEESGGSKRVEDVEMEDVG